MPDNARLFEIPCGEPPAGWRSGVARFPDSPVVLLSCNARGLGSRFPFGPAHQIIEKVDRGGWRFDELLVPVRVGQAAQVQQHSHGPASLSGVDKRSSHECVAQPVRAVRRVGHDVLGQRLV